MFFASGMTILLPVMGGIYAVTALSVILQVGYYKRTGKRIFKMSPIHHHFELSGMTEQKVVIMYSIITGILSFIALFSIVLME